MVNNSTSKSSPSTPQESGSKVDKKTGGPTTTSGKKMKQTRLSFASGAPSAAGSLRKRKLSSPLEKSMDRTVKIVRREGDPLEVDDPVVVIVDEDNNVAKANDVSVEGEDSEMVEIIPCEESNSVADLPASSNGDVSIVEKDVNQPQEVEDVEDEDVEEVGAVKDDDGDDLEEPVDESINLDNSCSEDASGEASEGGSDKVNRRSPRRSSLSIPLEPPTNPNGKPLTPRQLEKFQEKKAKHEERIRQRLEREEQKKKEREEREEAKRREREEKESAKQREKEEKENAKQKEKEEKESAKQKEKEERERKKQLELEQRNEEKRRKEEQREEEKRRKEEQKEEERRKKEEEKRQKELEEENKRKRASQAFTKFFKVGPKAGAAAKEGTDAEGNGGGQQQDQDDVVEVVHQYFMPFAVKGDMKLAPTVRRVLSKESKGALDRILQGNDGATSEERDSYLKSLKTKSHVPLKGSRTWITSDSSDDDSEDELMVVDDGLSHGVEKAVAKQKYRAKYLMFKENRRPAYYGTWQKNSKTVGPRRPFAKDEKFFDYEVDSDEEWEEEEPGESLHGSDDEKEKESEDDYEVDNDFFVPHGHLSDEELQNEDNEMDDNSPEAQKVKLKLRQEEFNSEMKKKTEKIKPRLIGCIWVNETGGRPENCPEVFWDLLQFRAILSAGPIVLRPPPGEDAEGAEPGADGDADTEDNNNNNSEEKHDKRKGQGLMEEEIGDLIRLVHGNLNSHKFMVKEFQKYREKRDGEAMKAVTNMSILRKIKEIASWENGCWAVRKECLEQYGITDLALDTCKWEYTLAPKRTKETMAKAEKKSVPNSPQVVGSAQAAAGAETAARTPVRPPAERESPKSAAKQKTATASKNSITQFTKVLTTEEKQKQFQAIGSLAEKKANENKAPMSVAVNPPVTQKAAELASKVPVVVAGGGGDAKPPATKKRVPLLMSVPRGQAIPEQSKNVLIKNFLKKPEDTEKGDQKKGCETKVQQEPAIVETIELE